MTSSNLPTGPTIVTDDLASTPSDVARSVIRCGMPPASAIVIVHSVQMLLTEAVS